VKEKFSKLLLGEDMSGTGKGVSSALALSNAITNLAGIPFSLSLSWILPLFFWKRMDPSYCFPIIFGKKSFSFLPRFYNLSLSLTLRVKV
jgi:hypothetical protein